MQLNLEARGGGETFTSRDNIYPVKRPKYSISGHDSVKIPLAVTSQTLDSPITVLFASKSRSVIIIIEARRGELSQSWRAMDGVKSVALGTIVVAGSTTERQKVLFKYLPVK